jgi:hypothetical protein
MYAKFIPIFAVESFLLFSFTGDYLNLGEWITHRVPRHIWGHGVVKVVNTDLKRRFQVSWCEIINYSIITII